MKRTMVTVFTISFLILAVGCNRKADLAQEKEKLLQTDGEFARTSREKGAAEAFRLFLTEDAMQLPARANPDKGQEEIYARMKESAGKYILEWEPQEGEVAKSGDMGWSWGKSIFAVIDDSGKTQKFHGKYLNVWKKQGDGSWKVLIDIGNQRPEPEKSEAE